MPSVEPQSCPRRATEAEGVAIRAALADASAWQDVLTGDGVGGGATYFRSPAQYGFVHTDATELLIESPILIGQWSQPGENLPSLLGWDVLQHFRLEIDGPNKTVSLHQGGA